MIACDKEWKLNNRDNDNVIGKCHSDFLQSFLSH